MREIKHICDSDECNKKAVVKVRIKSERLIKGSKVKTHSSTFGDYCYKCSRRIIK